jgi:uncharacterized protein (DUF3084 family)
MRWVLLAAVLWAFAFPAVAQTGGQADETEEEQKFIFEWTDDQGVGHITDRPEMVPKQYRPGARRIEAVSGQDPAQNRFGRPAAAEQEQEAREEAAWRGRMRAAKQALTDAQQRYRELEEKRNELLMSWGGVASGRLDAREEAERVSLEMKKVQDEIDKARSRIEVEIPEQARKAGVPPGWLRE